MICSGEIKDQMRLDTEFASMTLELYEWKYSKVSVFSIKSNLSTLKRVLDPTQKQKTKKSLWSILTTEIVFEKLRKLAH